MTSYAWRWEEGAVDKTLDHLEITFGDVSVTTNCKKWMPVALVSAPSSKRFSVQFLIETNSPEKQKMVDAVRQELDFYLVELSAKGRPDPWNYAQYHCTTASNAYSDVHWSYYKARLADGHHGAEGAGVKRPTQPPVPQHGV